MSTTITYLQQHRSWGCLSGIHFMFHIPQAVHMSLSYRQCLHDWHGEFEFFNILHQIVCLTLCKSSSKCYIFNRPRFQCISMGSKTNLTMLDNVLSQYLAISAMAIVLLSCWRKYRVNRSRPQLVPPGPTPLPVLGNILSIDTARPWLTFDAWRSTYGWYIIMGVYSQ